MLLVAGLAPYWFSGAASKEPVPGSRLARWPIKTSLPEDADLAKPAIWIDLPSFLELAPAAKRRTAAFQEKRYAKAAGAPAREGDIVRTQGYVRLVAEEPDGDLHIQISTQPDNFDNCLIVEVPLADEKFVSHSPTVLAAARTTRDFIIARLLHGAAPKVESIHVMKGQAYVAVTGQLFFDAEHQAAMAKGVFRGKSIRGKKLPSKTSWEIHPITAMIFVPKPT